jgi:hypothetical protein
MEKKLLNPEDQIEVNNSAEDEVPPHEIVALMDYTINLDLSQLDGWKRRFTFEGIFYNYPPCCIMEFIGDVAKKERPAERALDTNGFVPCKKHHDEYKDKIDMLHKLRVVYPESVAVVSLKVLLRCYGRREFEALEMPNDKRLLYKEIKNKRKAS